jgi:anti-sigma B factor antagonist
MSSANYGTTPRPRPMPRPGDETGIHLLDPSLLTVRFNRPAPGVVVVDVSGELDLATAPELDARLRHEVEEQRPRRLILDLSRLRFLGLQGIAVFCRARACGTAAGTDVSLVALSPTGARALEFAGVLSWFDRYPDLATALAAARTR